MDSIVWIILLVVGLVTIVGAIVWNKKIAEQKRRDEAAKTGIPSSSTLPRR